MMVTVTKKFQTERKATIRLRIALLGGFRIWVDPQLVPDESWTRHKVQALIKLLALTSRHCLHRDQLMEMLWPEAEMEAACNNLRQTLHLARQILKGNENVDLEILIDHTGWLCLTSEGQTWVDAEAFQTVAVAYRRGCRPGPSLSSIAAISPAPRDPRPGAGA